MLNLLLVEDDPRLGNYLATSLPPSGFAVTWCRGPSEVEALLQQTDRSFDCVVLDRMLGGSEGGELLQPLKNRFPNAGILILSSIDLPSEKAHWLERGADDYLGKPFELSELVARLRKVARTQRAPATLVGGDIVVDPVTQTTMANGKRIDLTRKEFLLLSLLMRYPGQVFSKSQILDRVWQIETTVESNVVEVTVRNVRKKLAEAKAKGTIESRRHVGYWFEA